MFTGLIQGCGLVRVAPTEQSGRLVVQWAQGPSYRIGDSIAIDGVCLTLVQLHDDHMHFDVGHATRQQTTFAELQQGALVHMEPALRVGDPLGGHFVTGHVDGIATVIAIEHCQAQTNRQEDGFLLEFHTKANFMPYLAAKGSVAIAGVSLTIYQVTANSFRVNLIPHTWRLTHFQHAKLGSRYNLEVDMLARYVLHGVGHLPPNATAVDRQEHHHAS